MTRTACVRLFGAAAICFASLSPASAQTPILIDDFESGIADANIPTSGPWRVNDSGRPAMYRSTNNPFSSGSMYAYLNDDVAATGVAYRFMSTNATDDGGLASQIGGHVTTFSFDFWETAADIDTPAQPGMGIGYYTAGASGTGIDLNAASRSFRAFLHNGLLSPDLPLEGEAVEYEREKVHTLYMIANDTASTVANYRGSQSLGPAEADVWISLDGAEPIFAFTVVQQNFGFSPWGVGFRTFTLDIEEFLVDDVLLVSGASFDRSVFDVPGGLDGDYDGNGLVDGGDVLIWQRQLGSGANPGTGADGDSSGLVDGADLGIWAENFGQPMSLPAVGAVPEPMTAALLVAPLALAARRRSR